MRVRRTLLGILVALPLGSLVLGTTITAVRADEAVPSDAATATPSATATASPTSSPSATSSTSPSATTSATASATATTEPTDPAPAYAPLGRTGPALTVSASKLRSALTCHGTWRKPTATRGGKRIKLEPVLLSPGTGTTPKYNYSWNYERAYEAQQRPWCTVKMPQATQGDIQIAGEYVVYAIRTMYAKAGRKIAVQGHSQGGMSMRWALRFWPDTRTMVADVIGMAASNHGTDMAIPCGTANAECTPAVWQQLDDSHFLAALNSLTETFASISYTEIYTHNDEVVTPSTGDHPSQAVAGGRNVTNVAIQSICPEATSEHVLVGTVDPTAYALVMDALDHAGPAKPSRIDDAVCTRTYQPYTKVKTADQVVDLVDLMEGSLTLQLALLGAVGGESVPAEPTLRCYVYAAGC